MVGRLLLTHDGHWKTGRSVMCAYGETFQFSVETQRFFKKGRVTDAFVP
jgi:hypothetical protein